MWSELHGTTVCSDIPQAKTSNGVIRSNCVGIDDLGFVRVPKFPMKPSGIDTLKTRDEYHWHPELDASSDLRI